jgi:6-pyruvoyltetrahydropterin/6-carboxytetrahydropterin synthase
MRAVIRKRFRFDAAHSLPDHAGKCRGLHGHSYEAELCFQGEVKRSPGRPDDGMVLDFFDVSRWWEGEVEPLVDHRHLNETMPEQYLPTTAENLASWLFAMLAESGLPVCEVTVWETPSSSATIRG